MTPLILAIGGVGYLVVGIICGLFISTASYHPADQMCLFAAGVFLWPLAAVFAVVLFVGWCLGKI